MEDLGGEFRMGIGDFKIGVVQPPATDHYPPISNAAEHFAIKDR